MIGLEPIVRMAVPVGVVPVPLTTPRYTWPPALPMRNGRLGSPFAPLESAGTVICRVMFEGLIQVTWKLGSGLTVGGLEPETIPTLVASVGSAPPTNPEPVRFTENTLPGAAVGRLAGEMPVKMAAGEPTVRLIVTTVTVAGVLAVPGGPQVNVTVPDRTVPGADVLKSSGL